MMKEIQNLNILMKGITINGPMFDIHDNGVVKNYFATTSDSSMNASEDGIKSSISRHVSELCPAQEPVAPHPSFHFRSALYGTARTAHAVHIHSLSDG
jgi:hypothetical protein